MKRRALVALVFSFVPLVPLGCSRTTEDPLVERASFGVFFGGQIQDRKELPFELDEAKQRVGIRIDFKRPLDRAVPVRWEIERPLGAKSRPADSSGERVVEEGESSGRVGEQRLDVPLTLRRGQVLGKWHVRVKVDGRAVIERDVLVFDPRERRERPDSGG